MVTDAATYAGMFRRTAERAPDREALIFPHARLTYNGLPPPGRRGRASCAHSA
jgi:non-ribosomal peptide synthetase component F